MRIGIIPARYASTRFPGKLLADLHGKPVLWWTWRAARAAEELDRVIVAAGDEKIASAVRGFGAEVVEVFDDLPSGSDRVWRAYQVWSAECGVRSEESDIVVNIQGDEPMMDPGVIDEVVQRLIEDPEVGVATAATLIKSESEYRNPSCVKVVMNSMGRAMSFSREYSPPVPGGELKGGQLVPFRHIGIYAYRTEVLKRFTELPPSKLELAEKLEQLRLLEAGVKYAVAVVDYQGVAVDTEGDLERVRGVV